MPLSYNSTQLNMEKPGPEHDLFRQWAIEQDIEINGVEPAKFPGRGIGVVAERNIKEGEELVRVPISALLSTDSIVPEVKDAALAAGISVHGLLAMYLAISGQSPDEDPYLSWRRAWPSASELAAALPIQWPFALRGLRRTAGHGTWSPLPPSVNGEWSKGAVQDTRHAALATSASRLERQRRKVDKDWARAKALCEGRLEYPDYLYHWLIVNTRSFFFDMTEDDREDAAAAVDGDQGEGSTGGGRTRDDKMALCPYIDYFNHAAEGCAVGFSEDGYTVTSDRAYSRGEELFVSYGSHDNDLLLVDYGFILPSNKADAVPLDDLVLYGSSGVYKHRNLLKEHNYYGDYRVSKSDGICYRTQMATALLVLSQEDWAKVVKGQRELSQNEQWQINQIICGQWIKAWLDEAERALAIWNSDAMQDPKEVDADIRRVAMERWDQIQEILRPVLLLS